ncbi:MAG: class I SAM-dependent methyltransferase [Bacteroidota bacterium]
MVIKPFKIKLSEKYSLPENASILDIGAGSHSATIIKKWLPKCNYTGIDISRDYHNDESDFKAMDEFFEIDLTKLKFDIIPENKYDLIIMSHVIEHLYNGDKVITGLTSKLKKGGLMYIEFPSEKSITFPSMRETLNFFDDATHCRIYSLKELCNLLMNNKCKILKAGTRRQWINIFVMPFKIPIQLISKRYVRAGVFWDLFGFADFIIAKK